MNEKIDEENVAFKDIRLKYESKQDRTSIWIFERKPSRAQDSDTYTIEVFQDLKLE